MGRTHCSSHVFTRMTYKRRKYHRGETHIRKKYKGKRRTKDLDEIDNDLNHNSKELLAQPVDVEKAGNAQYYCIHCARYFIDEHALSHHYRTKVHKRRLKALELEPYTIEESERAAGLGGSYHAPQKRRIVTQLPKILTDKLEANKEASSLEADAEESDPKKLKLALEDVDMQEREAKAGLPVE